MSGRPTIRVGDVFTVPLDARKVGFGQVAAKYGTDAYFFALFEPSSEREAEVDFSILVQGAPVFLALSLDAKLHAGHWLVVGNEPVASDLPLPAFKEMVGGPERVDVVDFSGTRRRPAKGEEGEWLPIRTLVSPARLEKALRARHGLESWNDAYSALEPSLTATTARLFDDRVD